MRHGDVFPLRLPDGDFLLTLVVIYVLSEISLMPTSNGFVELSVP